MIQQVQITDTLHADAGRARCRAVDVHHVLAWCLRQQCGPAGGILDGVWGASMKALVPLESLYEGERGRDLPLPSELATLYGRLQFPLHPGRPYIIGNFVTTLDGVSVKRGGSHLFLRYTFETKEVAT